MAVASLIRRLFLLTTTCALLLAAFHLYHPTAHTDLYDTIRYWNVQVDPNDKPMSYGAYGRPSFDHVTLLGALPTHLVPTLDNKRRLIVVGDIHGMNIYLGQLLEKVGFDPSRDHLVATGDMISKGPDSSGVIDRLMSLGASAVRGNHEDRVLLAWDEHKSKHGVAAELDSVWAEGRRGASRDLAVARSLSKAQRKWLQNLPVILTAEPLPLYVVHAGLVPGIALRRQDPWAVMNMRTLVYPRERHRKGHVFLDGPDAGFVITIDDEEDANSDEDEDAALDDAPPLSEDEQKALSPVAIPVDGRKGHKWANAWNKHQKRLPRRQRKTVVYGHDAKQGFREGAYTLGLDSNCVRGGRLTAMIVEAGAKGFTHKAKHVSCKNMMQQEEDEE